MTNQEHDFVHGSFGSPTMYLLTIYHGHGWYNLFCAYTSQCWWLYKSQCPLVTWQLKIPELNGDLVCWENHLNKNWRVLHCHAWLPEAIRIFSTAMPLKQPIWIDGFNPTHYLPKGGFFLRKQPEIWEWIGMARFMDWYVNISSHRAMAYS